MNEQQAGTLAGRAASFYRDQDDRAAHAIDTALSAHLRDFIPESPLAAVVGDGTGALVLILDGDRLYALQPAGIPSDFASASVRCRMRPLIPEKCRIEVETIYRGQSWTFVGGTRETTWRITVEDLDLEFKTARDLTTGRTEDVELLAERLVQVLGWNFPPPSAGLEEVA